MTLEIWERVMPSLDGRILVQSAFQRLTTSYRRHFIHRDTLTAASAIYKGMSYVPPRWSPR